MKLRIGAIAHNLNHVLIKMPQWKADSLNSTLLNSGADRPGLEYDRVEDQSGWQDKRADFR